MSLYILVFCLILSTLKCIKIKVEKDSLLNVTKTYRLFKTRDLKKGALSIRFIIDISQA